MLDAVYALLVGDTVLLVPLCVVAQYETVTPLQADMQWEKGRKIRRMPKRLSFTAHRSQDCEVVQHLQTTQLFAILN